MGAINTQQMAQTQENIAQTQAATAIAMNEEKIDAKLAGDLLKYDAQMAKAGGQPQQQPAQPMMQ
jgi:hypothetical protein